MSSDDTRDIAIKAFTALEEHVKSCDRRYSEWKDRQERMLDYLKEQNKSINNLNTTIAEQRGAGKLAKAVMGGAAALAGGISGLAATLIHK